MYRNTPVAFFAYNRPEHTDRALCALAGSRRLEDCDFYFFSDAPKNEGSRARVMETRAVLQRWAKTLNATLVEREENFGLAKSISTVVSDLCCRYGRVIVIEDDLVVSPDFLHFMIESLDSYEDEPRVLQVGGFTIRPPDHSVNDAFLLPVTTTWGWATWQRAWKDFTLDIPDMDAAREDTEWMRLFNFTGSKTYSAMMEDRIAGRNDSWGILWWYAVSRKRGLVVYPSKSLVWNGGFDGSGIHCGNEDFLKQGEAAVFGSSSLPNRLSFPEKVNFDADHFSQLKDYFRLMQTPAGRSVKVTTRLIVSLNAFARKAGKMIRNAFF